MRRGRPLVSEILERRHDAAAEEGLPLPVDRHPGGERMTSRHEPLGQRQPIGGSALRQAGEKRRHGRGDLLPGLCVFPAMAEECLPRVVGRALTENERRRPTAELRFESADLLHRLNKLRGGSEKPTPHSPAFRLGPLRGRLPQGRLFRCREPSGLGALRPRHREPEAAKRAGVMAFELHHTLDRRPGGDRLGKREHRCMGPPLIAIGAPPARHVAIEGERRGALAPGEGRGAIEGIARRGYCHPCSARRDLELREEKVPLRPLVPGQARAIGRQARVGEDLEADRLHRMVGCGEDDLVAVALGDIAACEDRAVVADAQVRHGGLPRLRRHDPPVDRLACFLPLPAGEAFLERRRCRLSFGGGNERPLSRQLVPRRLEPGGRLGHGLRLLGVGDHPLRLVGVVEAGKQPVIVGLGEGIIFMVVALRAAGRQPEPGDAGGAHPIDHRQIAKLERIDPPLLIDHRVAMEAGGDDVVGRVAGEEIASDLAAREGVEGHVVVESPDHPVAIGPDPPLAVLLIAVGVGIAGQVEPPPRPALAIPRAGKQSIDELFISLGAVVGDEGVELGWRRRQADQIEVDAPAERGPIGFDSRPQPFAGEPVADEEIDRIDRCRNASRVCHLRHGRPHRLPKRPVLGVGGTGSDPCLEDPLLLGRELRLRVGRGHDDVGVGAVDPSHELAVVGVARDDRPVPRIGLGEGVVAAVEA